LRHVPAMRSVRTASKRNSKDVFRSNKSPTDSASPGFAPSGGLGHRYYEPLRHPAAPGLAGVRLVVPDHAVGLPVLRTLSLCTCCRHYPGAAVGRRLRSSHPAVSAFPERVVGSARTSSFSRSHEGDSDQQFGSMRSLTTHSGGDHARCS
jgi:hypothetical protein